MMNTLFRMDCTMFPQSAQKRSLFCLAKNEVILGCILQTMLYLKFLVLCAFYYPKRQLVSENR